VNILIIYSKYGNLILERDLRSEYPHNRIHLEDREKNLHYMEYSLWILTKWWPLGWINVPDTINKFVNNLLRPYLGKFVALFFEDMRNETEHAKNISLSIWN